MKRSLLCMSLFALTGAVLAQVPDWPDEEREGVVVNYTEAKVGRFTLPDPLRLNDGRPVTDAETWFAQRRPEILRLFETHQFGKAPAAPDGITFDVTDAGTPAFDGKALRRQVTVYLSGSKNGPAMDLLIYLPAAARGPVPLLLHVGFTANNTLVRDPGVKRGAIWNRDGVREPAPDSSRFGQLRVLPFVEAGIGVATVYYGDIEPDFAAGLPHGIRQTFLRPGEQLAPDAWGAIAAWAWGLSRAMDYVETDAGIDAERVALIGVSRLGKTVLWTAAQDPRFAAVIASCSGEGGAALSRRNYGETIKLITLPQRFGYQFAGNYARYGDDPGQSPVDAHMLVSLVAPRPVLLQTGTTDKWSDPVGEFEAAVAAEPVFELLGEKGLGTTTMPPAQTPIFHTIGYYMHEGGHGTQPDDWDQYLAFLQQHLLRD
ncbi:MAG: hypothetical protein R2834_03245 [Rhodothermales bacterium]